MGETSNMVVPKSIDGLVSTIIDSGQLREKYDIMFRAVVNKWKAVEPDEEIMVMLDVMVEFCKRKKDGASTERLTTYLIAQANTNKSLCNRTFAQIFEVICLMTRGGGLVAKYANEQYSEENKHLYGMTRLLMSINRELSDIRDEYGTSSEAELSLVSNAFNLWED